MNAAEKAKRAREQQEKQKQARKEQFIGNLLKYFIIALMVAVVGVTLGILITSETGNIAGLAVCQKIGIGVLIGCAIGGVLAFFFGKEHSANWASLMVGTILFLGLVLWGMSGMLKGE